MAKRKAPPPMPPGRTQQSPDADMLMKRGNPSAAARLAGAMLLGGLIPKGGPLTGDATQQRSETAKKAKRR